MARINIEDSVYRDLRFLNLVAKTGSPHCALGMLVAAWSLAQKHWLKTGCIPVDHWPDDLNPLIDVGLASRRDESVYVNGSKEQFSWLTQRSEAGKSRSENKIDKLHHARCVRWSESLNGSERNLNEIRTALNGSEPLTPTLTLLEEKSKSTYSFSAELEKSTSSEKRTALRLYANEKELLTSIPDKTRARWEQLYPDVEYLRRETIKAWNWYENNPKRKPKQIRGWIRALSTWYEKGWVRHVKNIPSKKSVQLQEF